jgi:hypothetical protein
VTVQLVTAFVSKAHAGDAEICCTTPQPSHTGTCCHLGKGLYARTGGLPYGRGEGGLSTKGLGAMIGGLGNGRGDGDGVPKFGSLQL